MTFGCADEVGEEIAKYAISRGVALKFVRSEPRRIRVNYEDGCLFLLYVRKDGSNPELETKTLVTKRNCYIIFSNPRASSKFLVKLYEQNFLKKHDYKVKDLK